MSRDRIQLILGFFLSFIASGVSAQPVHRCDFDTQMVKISPAGLDAIEEEIAHGYGNVLQREIITLPVVFHVIYTTSQENISDLQIRSQIDILNRDFAFMSDNAPGVPVEFTALGGDSGIRFCLASKDPNGNPTTGITRTMTQVSRIGSRQESNGRRSIHYDIYGGKAGWDPERYINVWVGDLDGLLGNATFPGMAPQPEEDGVIIDPEFVGALGLASQSDPFDRGHTLTHELGHYFGLFHIWGQGNGGCDTDDLVEDTPEQEFPYLDCPEYPQFSCGSSDMFMNFMDFTNDRCLALFTKGQNARMQTVLMGLRSSLLENADACTPPDSRKIRLEEVQLFYAPTSRQIVIALETESLVPREVSLFAIDGRLIYLESWMTGSVFSLDADRFPSGVYIIQLESGGSRVSRKVVVD